MSDFNLIDWGEKFGEDWWADVSNPSFGQERNC
jgi:hypothetical protein